MLELQNALEEKWIDLQSRLRGYKDVWLGASDIQHEGKYVSVSNAERLQYINWASGQPNNGGGSRNEHCGSYWISNRGMRDAPCKENHNYSACHLIGADILELQNALEEKWIDLQSRLRGYKDVWLGASDIQHEGKYVSVSNAERLQYINWASGQPSGSRNEHCASYWISNRGMRDSPLFSWHVLVDLRNGKEEEKFDL
ncbi:C-type lectin domain family 4 member M-like [Saccostrea echinata]|uniref:C-type lectin domain family 4 member M-like n=1 Tax=Saccostrea echinata TaxID=191078 RepID=UPI002A817CD2|nr:C-type lectin domain family 4 member M-like [Saccostrea echinata]